MKVYVDTALCAGHGRCAIVAPSVYALDDDGYNAAAGKHVDVSPEHAGAARLGSRACPDTAILLIEDE